MPTEVVWNQADPPATPEDHLGAEWLVMIARRVGITTVTPDHATEWLWRFAFVQEMSGRRFRDYEPECRKLSEVLDRFQSVRLEGRVCDQHRDEFVRDLIASKIECSREGADSVVGQYLDHAPA